MILGRLQSKFVVGGTTVLLDHSKLNPKFLIPNEIEHVSILNGVRNYILIGDMSELTIILNLTKYSDPVSKFNEVNSFKHSECLFYPNRDGYPLKDYEKNDALFYISEVTPYYLTNDDFYDLVLITFKNRKAVSFAGEIPAGFGNNFADGLFE